jgi:hypothetical protein
MERRAQFDQSRGPNCDRCEAPNRFLLPDLTLSLRVRPGLPQYRTRDDLPLDLSFAERSLDGVGCGRWVVRLDNRSGFRLD